MGRLFNTDATATINAVMTVQPHCFDDRYNAEVQFAELKVWNESTRLFCSVSAEMVITDLEDSRNNAVILIDDGKIDFQSLLAQIKYKYIPYDGIVEINLLTTTSQHQADIMREVIINQLEIDVEIEGI